MSVLERVQHIPEQVKVVGDALSITAVLGTLAGALPVVAALFTIVWTAIRIYETDTVQKMLGRRQRRRTDAEPPA